MRCDLRGALILMLALAACNNSAPPPAPQPAPAASQPASVDAATLSKLNEGAGLMGLFQFEDAERVYAEVVRAHPHDRDAKLNLAISILNQTGEGAQERAIKLLDDLIARNKYDFSAQYCAGIVQLFLGSPDAALTHFEQAVGPDSVDAYVEYYWGQCLEFANRREDALAKYEAAAQLDPYLRSPHLGSQRVLARLGREEEAAQALKDYLALDGNPRGRIAEFKYTRMGPKSEVVVPRSADALVAPVGKPPYFSPSEVVVDGEPRWASNAVPVSLTVADIDGDGALDLFATNAIDDGPNAVLLGVKGAPSRFHLARDHPLTPVTEVRAALWGDVDNDGRVDVYLCRKGANQLWMNLAKGWKDVSDSSGASGGERDTVDGVIADFDHDGDLDIYLVNADGPCELLSNNSDGTFRAIGQESGASGDARPARRAVVADFDGDRDADIYLVHSEPPNELLLNDRLWRYPSAAKVSGRDEALDAALVADIDADGGADLVAQTNGGKIIAWCDKDRRSTTSCDAGTLPSDLGGGIAVMDIEGDGRPWIVGFTADHIVDFRGGAGEIRLEPLPDGLSARAWAPLVNQANGPALMILNSSGLVLLGASPTRGNYLTLAVHGRIDPAQAMRSNASGIGARIAVRRGDTWSIVDTLKSSSGPGQSLQPIAIGLGSSKQADFIAIEWSDGLMQTEMNLAAGTLHKIVETQRQISSCPVIFAWDGTQFRFVTDCLGVGGIGYLVGVKKGIDGRLAPEYAPPRPWERVLLPESLSLMPRDGALELRLAEPMEEALYLDGARLVAYDVPPGWSITIDERMGLADPQPTGEVRAYRRAVAPVRATDADGNDVLPSLSRADGVAAAARDIDSRFIGLLRTPQTITLEFGEPLDANVEPTLVAHGWIEYPYCQTNFAAWQAGLSFDAPDLWARDADGAWAKVLGPWGYPAGMPREMSLPLAHLPNGTTALRLTTNQEIYWDAFAVVWVESCPDLAREELPLVAASANESGFQQRIPQPQKRAQYDYAQRPPFWATRHQPGFYTAFGACIELLTETEDAVAIIGPGEEIRLRFAIPKPLREGWTRRYVLEIDGWCKDMDVFTGDGETLGPLPTRDGSTNPRRDELHRRFQTRWRDGY